MKSWEPQAEFERADFPRKKEGSRAAAGKSPAPAGKEVKAWRPRSVDEASQAPAKSRPPGEDSALPAGTRVFGNPAAPAAKPGAAMGLLGQSIVENLESAAVALRSLYWDKKDQAVGGKRRIKAILTYAGPQALKALRSVLTPMEREQFAEISRTERACDAALAEQVCRDFIARLRHI